MALAGTLAVALATVTALAPAASAGTTTVDFGSCTSSNPALAAPPPDYSSQVTLTPSAASVAVGSPVTITWHYSLSTAPSPGIPIADAATAKAAIVVGGAASTTLSAGPSAAFPPAPVATGGTFQIPDFTATFTPTTAGTYTFTPGNNEQDVAQFGIVIQCAASGASAAATVTATNASASVGSAYVRPGGTVGFTGAGWIAGETVTPSFKDSAGTATTGTAITVPAGGAVSGSLAVPAAAATGAGSLVLTGSTSGAVPTAVTVLGAPTLSASPSSGGPGTVVGLSGGNWDPGATVAVSGVDASSNPVGSSTTLTADASGHLSGSYTVPGTAIAAIGAAELVGGAPSTTLRAAAAFTFAGNACTADAAGAPVSATGTCSVPQSANVTVSGGPLQLKENTGAVTFPGVTLDGTAHNQAGSLQQVEVQDFRGTTDGWVLNATMSDLALTGGPYANSGAAPIPAGDVSASALKCAGNPAGTTPYPSTPTAGSGGALSPTTAITLCSQAAGGTNPPTVTGGDFLVDAGLNLSVPAYLLQGTYTGTVTITLQ
ncbi:hypothetical protein KGQ20_05655 [Catenulispora sp. NF23]|uniref:WxL domain-containing protein n=1 Tax=Catenulispora pinistramenti TaxID=2705254 RepID=A0ABS5KIY7_9ACTN|nr:hypothetical protein [Catenulispora pinistramenti]MBS2532252.1 hypothetical protein [Catenulispora pinistramenti]MBS2546347.1 hypothetical protein [Catenulispora pinistramenti]